MTLQTDVVKMGYSEDEIFAVLNESGQARTRRQMLAKVSETVAAYRLREMKDLQTRAKLATWRGYLVSWSSCALTNTRRIRR